EENIWVARVGQTLRNDPLVQRLEATLSVRRDEPQPGEPRGGTGIPGRNSRRVVTPACPLRETEAQQPVTALRIHLLSVGRARESGAVPAQRLDWPAARLFQIARHGVGPRGLRVEAAGAVAGRGCTVVLPEIRERNAPLRCQVVIQRIKISSITV